MSQKNFSLTSAQVRAHFLGNCSASTFWRIRKSDETFPKSFTLHPGGKPLFDLEQVTAWYKQRRAEAA